MKSLLLVDDEDFIRQSYSDFFEDRGWFIAQAESGEKALEIMRGRKFDAAIVDIRLGGMTGEDFIRRAVKTASGMVYVICTGSPEYSAADDLLSLSRVSSRVFRKPVTEMSGLEAEIEEMLGR